MCINYFNYFNFSVTLRFHHKYYLYLLIYSTFYNILRRFTYDNDEFHNSKYEKIQIIRIIFKCIQ